MKIFVSYSHRDEITLERLKAHLSPLRREGRIETWYDREIRAGGEIDDEISRQLETCNVFILLISPDFLNSDYCMDKEMALAMERHEEGSGYSDHCRRLLLENRPIPKAQGATKGWEADQ